MFDRLGAAPILDRPLAERGGGTLAWIGPTGRGECVDAFRFCAAHALQIAPRRSLQDLIDRPAEGVGRVVVVRMDRRSAAAGQLEQLEQLFPGAAKTLLLGGDCEGEGRTGESWPGFERLYWHRWNQVIPSWFAVQPAAASALAPRDAVAVRHTAAPRTGIPPAVLPHAGRRSVAIIGSSRSAVDGLLDAVAALGHAVVWLPTIAGASVRNVDVCLWDDSAAPPASTSVWRDRLAASLAVAVRERPRHGWVVGFPRIDQWNAARRAGVETLISKPYGNDALARFINSPA